ncbi:MAG: hypothetical protein P8130_07665 [Deltaproteobacteria bacterium]
MQVVIPTGCNFYFRLLGLKLFLRTDHDMATSTPDTPPQDLRRKYRILNYALITILAISTLLKTLVVIKAGSLAPTALAGLVVPVINVYFIRLLLQFRKIGYQFVFLLSILALVYPENRQPVEFALHLLLIIMSGHLYLRLFPGKNAGS